MSQLVPTADESAETPQKINATFADMSLIAAFDHSTLPKTVRQTGSARRAAGAFRGPRSLLRRMQAIVGTLCAPRRTRELGLVPRAQAGAFGMAQTLSARSTDAGWTRLRESERHARRSQLGHWRYEARTDRLRGAFPDLLSAPRKSDIHADVVGINGQIKHNYQPKMRRFTNTYNDDGKEKRRQAREAAGNKCIRCGSPSVPGRILTCHHFDGDKSNDAWHNLLPLCQVCHLQVQAKVDPHISWMFEHSDWLKPYVAGFYALKYEGRQITREEAESRLEELLSRERLA